MSKKQIKFLIPLGALLLTLVLLTGCRPSDALTRLMNAMNALNPSTEEMKTEDEENEDTPDSQMDPMDEQRDDAKIDETEELIGQMLEDMDWETAQEALMTVYSASATSNEWGAQQYNPDRLTYGSGGALVLNVSGDEINSASKIAGRGEGSGSEEASVVEASEERDDNDLDAVVTELPPEPEGTTPSPSESFGESQSPSASASAVEPTPSPETPSTEPVNPSDSGSPYTPPEYKNAGERIAATGEVAIVVCMLGGSDRLCATSSGFNSNVLAQKAFNGDSQMDYETPWTGDGSYWLDDGDPNGDNFKYLMEYLQPDICFDLNNTSFSPEQGEKMADYGVTYKNMAPMTSQTNINNCLYTVANEMGSEEAQEIAIKYATEWVPNEISTIAANTKNKGTCETVFIEAWDENVKTIYTSSDTGQSEEVASGGAAVVKIGSSFRPLNEFLKQAKVYDWAAAPHMRGYSLDEDYGTGTAHGGMPVESCWDDMTGVPGANIDDYGSLPGSLCYVSPIYDPAFATDFGSQNVQFVGGQYSEIDNRVYTTSTPTDNGGLSFGNVFPGYSDGTSAWNAVIVKSQKIKDYINGNKANDAWTYNGNYNTWSSAKRIPGSNERVTYNGILVPLSSGGSYYTTVANTYSVYVNPKGIGDWVEGSPESILESVWAAGWISGGYTQGYAEGRIRNFYETFYHYTLTDDDLAYILTGPKE